MSIQSDNFNEVEGRGEAAVTNLRSQKKGQDIQGRSNGPPVRTEINAFLSPAYWGSLIAFLISLVGTLLLAIVKGPPVQLMDVPDIAAGGSFVVGSAVIVVLAYVIRYYSAVAVQLFGLSEESLFRSPPGFRKAMFVVLSLIVLLAGINTFVVGSVGVILALIGCVVQSCLALLCLLAIWIGRQFRPELFEGVKVPFAGGEIFFIAIVGYLIYALAGADEGRVQGNGIVIGGAVAWTIWFTSHEWSHRYAGELWRQMVSLKRILEQQTPG